MGEPVETYLDADEVAARAADLVLAAERNRAEIAGPTGRIRELNAAEPWGHDDVGNTFRASYLGTSTEDGDAVESVLAGGEEICDHVYALGQDAGVGAITTRLVDQEGGEEFARMLARMEENRALLDQEAGTLAGMVAGGVPAGSPPVVAPGPPGSPPVVPSPASPAGESPVARRWAYRVGASGSALRSGELVRQALAARLAARPMVAGSTEPVPGPAPGSEAPAAREEAGWTEPVAQAEPGSVESGSAESAAGPAGDLGELSSRADAGWMEPATGLADGAVEPATEQVGEPEPAEPGTVDRDGAEPATIASDRPAGQRAGAGAGPATGHSRFE